VAVLDLASSPARVTLRFPPDIDFRPFSWSSDGRWVAGAARYAMRDQLVLLDLQERKRRVIADNGSSPAWLPDGKRLLFSSPTHLTLLDVATGTMQEVVPLPRQYDSWGRTVSLSHDGRTLAYLQSQSEGDVWLMTLSPGSTAARRP
jgi:Tol biopolymer transport system component